MLLFICVQQEGKVQSEGDIVVKDGAEQGDLVPLSLPTLSGGAPSHSAEDFVSCKIYSHVTIFLLLLFHRLYI